MRKMLLASNGQFLFDEGYSRIGIPFGEFRIAWITTASKGARSLDYLARHRTYMQKLGLKFEEIDIEGKTPEQLRRLLRDKNVIHVEGGNTFYLLRAIRACDFKTVVNESLARGLVYIGTSAGSYVACINIEPSTWNPDQRNHFGVTDFTGMGLVPFAMKVHYTDGMQPWLEKRIHDVKYPVRIVRDGQGILVEDDAYTFVGKGSEVMLQ